MISQFLSVVKGDTHSSILTLHNESRNKIRETTGSWNVRTRGSSKLLGFRRRIGTLQLLLWANNIIGTTLATVERSLRQWYDGRLPSNMLDAWRTKKNKKENCLKRDEIFRGENTSQPMICFGASLPYRLHAKEQQQQPKG